MSEIESLRAAFRESCAGSDGGHLSEDQWERFACGEMSSDERESALDHIVGCSLCSDTYRAVEILQSEASTFDDEAPAPAADSTTSTVRRFPLRAFGWLALAAVVVIAVALPLRQTNGPATGDGATVVRSAGGGQELTAISPKGRVEWPAGEDVIMEWAAADPPIPAVVEILDADGELVWTGPEVEANRVAWPGETIPGTGRFYWRVLARDPAADVADSELVSFDLVGTELSANHP